MFGVSVDIALISKCLTVYIYMNKLPVLNVFSTTLYTYVEYKLLCTV